MHSRSTRRIGFRKTSGLALMAAALLVGGSVASAQPVSFNREVASATETPLRTAINRKTDWLAYRGSADPQTVTKSGSNWFARHPVVTGTSIGTGAGLALSQVDAIGGVNHDPRVALIGAAAGAWGGLIASASQTARAGRKVGVGTKIGIALGAASLTVLPVVACYGAGGCGGSS